MAPLACLAIFPVSRIRERPPTSTVTLCGAGMLVFSDIADFLWLHVHAERSCRDFCLRLRWGRKEARAEMREGRNATDYTTRTAGQAAAGCPTIPQAAAQRHADRLGVEVVTSRKRSGFRSLCRKRLLAQAKAFNNLAIPIRVAAVEIVQQTAALVDHHDQSAPGCMVFYVGLEVRRQVADPLAQKSNLHLW